LIGRWPLQSAAPGHPPIDPPEPPILPTAAMAMPPDLSRSLVLPAASPGSSSATPVTEGVVDHRESSALRTLFEHAVFWSAVGTLAVSGIAVTAVSLVARPFLSNGLRARLGQALLHRYFRRYFRVLEASGLFEFDLSALDALRDRPACVLAANHPALLDAMLVAARVPNLVGIMKADVRHSPIYAGPALLAGYARADRPIEMIHAMVRAIHDGRHVLVFPESTRTTRSPVNAFKGNFALIAKQAGVPVQSVVIETDSPYLRKGWPLFRKPPMPVRFRARLGREFDASGEVKATLRAVEAWFAAELSGGPRQAIEAEPAAQGAPASEAVAAGTDAAA